MTAPCFGLYSYRSAGIGVRPSMQNVVQPVLYNGLLRLVFWLLVICSFDRARSLSTPVFPVLPQHESPALPPIDPISVKTDYSSPFPLPARIQELGFTVWERIRSSADKMPLAAIEPKSGPLEQSTVVTLSGIGFKSVQRELEDFLSNSNFTFDSSPSSEITSLAQQQVLNIPSLDAPPQFFMKSIQPMPRVLNISDIEPGASRPSQWSYRSILPRPKVYVHVDVLNAAYMVIEANVVSDTHLTFVLNISRPAVDEHRYKISTTVPPAEVAQNRPATSVGVRQLDENRSVVLSPIRFPLSTKIIGSSVASSKETILKKAFISNSILGERHMTLLEDVRPKSLSQSWAFISVHCFPFPLYKARNPVVYTMYPSPTVDDVVPRSLSLTGGESVYLYGTQFFASDVIKVKFYSNETYLIETCDFVMTTSRQKLKDQLARSLTMGTDTTSRFPDNKLALRTPLPNHRKDADNDEIAILCKSPPWTSEGTVKVALSFNGQTYHEAREINSTVTATATNNTNNIISSSPALQPILLSYTDPSSLLGDVAKGIIERPKIDRRPLGVREGNLLNQEKEELYRQNFNEGKEKKFTLIPQQQEPGKQLSQESGLDKQLPASKVTAETTEVIYGIETAQPIVNVPYSQELSRSQGVIGKSNRKRTSADPAVVVVHDDNEERKVAATPSTLSLQEIVSVETSTIDPNTPRRLPNYRKRIHDLLTIYLEDSDQNAYVLSRPADIQQLRSDLRLIGDITTLLIAATLAGFIAEACRLPTVLGQIGGGVLVGPHCWNKIQQLIQLHSIAQLGSVFLLFGLGFHFSITKIAKVARAAFANGFVAQFIFLLFFGYVALWKRTSISEGLVIGAYVTMSSTAVCSRDIVSRHVGDTHEAHVTIGILLIQDVLLGLLVTLIPSLNPGGGQLYIRQLGASLLSPLFRACCLVLAVTVLAVFVLPHILGYIQRAKSSETFFLCCVALIVGMSMLSEHMDLSLELGAFAAGLMMSRSPLAVQKSIEVAMDVLKHFWGCLFFAALGLVLDPFFIWDNFYQVITVVLLFTVLKFIVFFLLLLVCRYDGITAGRVALMLSHMGEFGFVILGKAVRFNLLTRKLYLLLLGATDISLIMTPLVLQLLNFIPTGKHFYTAPTEPVFGWCKVLLCTRSRMSRVRSEINGAKHVIHRKLHQYFSTTQTQNETGDSEDHESELFSVNSKIIPVS